MHDDSYLHATCYTTAGVPIGEATRPGQISFKVTEERYAMTAENLHCNSSIHHKISECPGATLPTQRVDCYTDFNAQVICEGQLNQ